MALRILILNRVCHHGLAFLVLEVEHWPILWIDACLLRLRYTGIVPQVRHFVALLKSSELERSSLKEAGLVIACEQILIRQVSVRVSVGREPRREFWSQLL